MGTDENGFATERHDDMSDADIGFLLNKATRRFRLRLADALAATGLTPQQAAALIAIARSEQGALKPSSLAEAIDTDPATTSGLIERLSRDGWVSSFPNREDGRSRLIGLTDRAMSALPSVMRAAEQVSSQSVACLTSDEVRTLTALLSRLCEIEAAPSPSANTEQR